MEKLQRDWKRPEDYESLKDLKPDRWAWEFLRRNPDYRREYHDLTAGLSEHQAAVISWTSVESRKYGLYSWLDPDREYFNIRFTPPGGELAVISSLDFQKTSGTVFCIPGAETGEVYFRFNTMNPITPQIESAKAELLRLQKNQGGNRRAIFKPRRDEWPILIRILDATSSGEKDSDIADVLFPDECSLDPTARIKKVFDKRLQALRYATFDYRYIPSFTE